MQGKILELYVIVGEQGGHEAICTAEVVFKGKPTFLAPLQVPEFGKLPQLTQQAQALANATRQTVKIIKLSAREELGTVTPED
jgi:hypothetical protein